VKRVHLFRWWKRTQVDIDLGSQWLCLGIDRHGVWQPIAYLSPDATPVHREARGWKGR
jgi:hypothetical protein